MYSDSILLLHRVKHWIRKHRFCVPWRPLIQQSLRLLRLFGNTTSKKVTPSVGPEQEYFLVDKQKYLQRKDLIYTGRTLFGAMPPKGQELDDHYFGTIRQRIASFMKDVNEQLWKLGVTAKTQHNEVAPAQHELAPIYCRGKHRSRPQPAGNEDLERRLPASTDCSACFMRNPSQESMVPVNTITGPLPPMTASTFWIRARPLTKMYSSCWY